MASVAQLRLTPNCQGKVELGLSAPVGLRLQFVIEIGWSSNDSNFMGHGCFAGEHTFEGGWISQPILPSSTVGSSDLVIRALFQNVQNCMTEAWLDHAEDPQITGSAIARKRISNVEVDRLRHEMEQLCLQDNEQVFEIQDPIGELATSCKTFRRRISHPTIV